MHTLVPRLLAGAAIALSGNLVLAHDGHGLTGIHWHATDSLGFVGFTIALAVALWLSHGGK